MNEEKDDEKNPVAKEVYQDGAKGLISNIGEEIADAGRPIGKTLKATIMTALKPIQYAIWGFEQVEQFILNRLPEKLKNTLPENIIQPKPQIAAPTIQYLRYIPDEPQLADLFLNLLATAMDKDKYKDAHPSFVEILKQITSDEAKILLALSKCDSIPKIKLNSHASNPTLFTTTVRSFSTIGYDADCEMPGNIQEYFDNLVRLGILEILDTTYIAKPELYSSLENHKEILKVKKQIESSGRSAKVVKGLATLTDFGRKFCNAAIR